MKKFTIALMAVLGLVFGPAAVANAYPPSGALITVSNATPQPGDSIQISVDCGDGSDSGDTVTVNLGDSSATGTCVNGSATVTIAVPTAEGTINGEVLNADGENVGTFTVTVAAAAPVTQPNPSGQLPATGSDGIGTTTMIALGLLIAGLALFAVATVRRRQPIAA